MNRAATCPKENARLFIVDVPASLLKRNPKLSRDARRLYLTMRGLANGKTGELAIRGCPLDWRYISRQAEMGRDAWQRAVRDLIAAGLVVRKRERVTIYRGGRRRVVLGRARYFVHRQARAAKQAKSEKDSRILLMPGFSTVEESGTQISSNTPYGSEEVSNTRNNSYLVESERKSSKAPAPDDDFCSLNPFLSEEDANTIRGIRRNLAETNPWLAKELQLDTISDDWLAIAMDHIEARGQGRISSPIQYFTRAFTNFFTNVVTDADDDRDMLDCINAEYDQKQELRERYRVKPQPLTPDQEERRHAFNANTASPPKRFP